LIKSPHIALSLSDRGNKISRSPAPELKKLDFFAGDWKSQAKVHGAPGTPDTNYRSTSHAEWMEGDFFLVEHWDFELDGVTGKELSIKGYDSERKVYTYHAFTSLGEAFYDTGTVDGDTWTWLRDESSDSATTKGRYTIKVTSPTSYTFRFETSTDGENWETTMEGNATKHRVV
jgi:uncharacterized protein DUF1579